MHRRTFLKSLGLGTSALALTSLVGPRNAWAAPDRSFVFAYFRGGWDTLMSLDPRDPGVFTEARKNETRIELGWDKLPATYARSIIKPAGSNIDFGPVMSGISRHYDKMCVVRGLSMDTVAHEVGRRYFTTGLPPSGTQATGSAIATRIAAQQGDHSPFPNLVMRAETYNEGLPSYASGLTVNSVTDLLISLTDLPGSPSATVRGPLDAFRSARAKCDPTLLDKHGLLERLQNSQIKARELVQSGLADKFQFTNQTDAEMQGIQQRYGISDLDEPQAQAAVAFQALKYELAQCVTVQLADNLDSHDQAWEDDHPDQLFTGFSALGQLVDDLASTQDTSRGGSLLDNTTILAFSEFGRTALINGRGGRDHSLTSSCMLLGAGVPGNRVVGASGDVGMPPRTVDAITGVADDSGVMVTPTLVAASLMQSAGYDVARLRTDGLPCLMA